MFSLCSSHWFEVDGAQSKKGATFKLKSDDSWSHSPDEADELSINTLNK